MNNAEYSSGSKTFELRPLWALALETLLLNASVKVYVMCLLHIVDTLTRSTTLILRLHQDDDLRAGCKSSLKCTANSRFILPSCVYVLGAKERLVASSHPKSTPAPKIDYTHLIICHITRLKRNLWLFYPQDHHCRGTTSTKTLEFNQNNDQSSRPGH